MQARRGQAVVEAIAVVGAVLVVVAAASAAGAFALLPRLAAPVADPSPPALAYLDRAVARPVGEEGPALGDALLRLAAEVGPERARALMVDRVLRVYAPAAPARRRALADPSWALQRPAFDGVGPAAAEVWSEEAPRAPATARLVTPADEAAWSASLRPSTPEHVVGLASSAAQAAAAAIGPEVSFAAFALGVGASALDDPERGVPAGSRDGDVLVCRFVWRRNLAAPGWAAVHPVDAERLALGAVLPVVELTVVRAGAPLDHVAVRSHATSC